MSIRIFGIEISYSPVTKNDDVVWNPNHRYISRIGDLSPNELRAELARVHQLATQGRWYWINNADQSQRLHEVNTITEFQAHQEIEARVINKKHSSEIVCLKRGKKECLDKIHQRLRNVALGIA